MFTMDLSAVRKMYSDAIHAGRYMYSKSLEVVNLQAAQLVRVVGQHCQSNIRSKFVFVGYNVTVFSQTISLQLL